MKVERMDAQSMGIPKVQESNSTRKESGPEIKETSEASQAAGQLLQNRNISQLSEFEKKELPISEKLVIDAIERANRAIVGANRKFEFSIHDKTKQIMVKVINSETNEVIREIPPEKTLDMVAKMWEMAGIMVDEKR